MLAAAFLSYASSTSNVVVSVDVSNVTNPSVNRKFMGCHSDYGFAQTPQGFSGNLVYGAAFGPGTEGTKPWSSRITGNQSSHPSVGIARGTSFAGQWSMSLYGGDGQAEVALVTRGIGGSGFSLEAGKPYTFAAWVWKSSTTTMFAELRDFTTNTSLARVTFDVVGDGPPWGATWQRYNVTLTPSAATTCVGIPFGSDPTIDCGGAVQDAVCVRCGGELLVGLAGGGSTPLTADSVSVETKAGGVTSSSGGGNVAVGHVSLMPGAWGLLHDKAGNPLPVLKSAADVLTEMGITTFRSGGSVSQSMRWKDWRGPEWNRPSSRAVWGRSETAGWGPFEVIDMCMALDIEPIITLAYDSNDETDWGDLVEYAFGDATTSWGARRHADGHAAVYNVSTFELGNEQYNPNFVEQVAAMEARAAVLNAAKGGTVPPMRYMFPFNGGLNAEDAQRAIDAKLPIERIMPDVHVGATGAVEAAATLFANPPVPGFAQSAINCETNAGSHDLKRALDEATDLIDWFTADTAVTNRLYARTASFCSGSAAHFDAWPQGAYLLAYVLTYPLTYFLACVLTCLLAYLRTSFRRHLLLPPEHDVAPAAGVRARWDHRDVGGADRGRHCSGGASFRGAAQDR